MSEDGDDGYLPNTVLSNDEFIQWTDDAATSFLADPFIETSEPRTLDQWIEDFGQFLGEVQRGNREL